MNVLEKVQKYERQGSSILHLEADKSDFDTPACIK
jgi:hypothetical protein